MPMIEWDNRLLIGVDTFDEHHKLLVELLNKAFDEFILGSPVEKRGAIVDELFDYASYHFTTEEFFMKKYNYPKVEQHIEEHNGFVNKLSKLQKDCRRGDTTVSLELVTFLKDWLIDHILKSDSDYSKYISSQENITGFETL